MDWLEKLFGWSPDNGDGSFEAMIVALCGFVVVSIIVASPRARAYLRQLLASLRTRS
jgi:hypothetical protein